MCGGFDNYNNLAECHSYNLRSQTWSEWSRLTQARYRLSLSLASDLAMVVAIGGNNEAQAATRTVETFDLFAKDADDTVKWTARPEWNIPKEINGHCSFHSST